MMALPSLWGRSAKSRAKERFANVHYREGFSFAQTELKPVLPRVTITSYPTEQKLNVSSWLPDASPHDIRGQCF